MSENILDTSLQVIKTEYMDVDEEKHLHDVAENSCDQDEQIFQVNEPLSDYRSMTRSMSELLTMLERSAIDLDPEYQRDVVWTAQRMSGLIDSIMENYYIPPLVFSIRYRKVTEGMKRVERVCVDGKQRLSSIQAFMNGEIPCHDNKGKKWYYLDKKIGARGRRRVLPDDSKTQFCSKGLLCFEYNELTHSQEESLFARVQRGIHLTPAETMRATNGPWQALAMLFEENFHEIVNLCHNGRSAGFRNLLACFAQIHELQSAMSECRKPLLKASSQALVKFMEDDTILDDSMRSHLVAVFTKFKDLFYDDPQAFKNNEYKRVKTFAPIEMIAVGVLVSKFGTVRSNSQLIGNIRDMRSVLRGKVIDLRTNSTTWNIVLEFMDDIEEKTITNDDAELASDHEHPLEHKSTLESITAQSPASDSAFDTT